MIGTSVATLGGEEVSLPDTAYHLGVPASLCVSCRPSSRIKPNRSGDEELCLDCESLDPLVGTTF